MKTHGMYVTDHIDRGDTHGLTPAEVAEERLASGAPARLPRGPKPGSRRAPPVRNPFDEVLRTLGLWERVQAVCLEHGVATHEIALESKSKRLVTVRRKVYGMLRDLGWSSVDTGRLFDKSHTTILAALK